MTNQGSIKEINTVLFINKYLSDAKETKNKTEIWTINSETY